MPTFSRTEGAPSGSEASTEDHRCPHTGSSRLSSSDGRRTAPRSGAAHLKKQESATYEPAYLAQPGEKDAGASQQRTLPATVGAAEGGSGDTFANPNGLPLYLKDAMESFSGEDLSDVTVHHNSREPKQIGAAAFARGKDIYLAEGQEKHLPHEAWHVVQQMQGRVAVTTGSSAAPSNDDANLEREADQMGAKAHQMPEEAQAPAGPRPQYRASPGGVSNEASVVQRVAPAFLGVSAAAWGVAANVASVVGAAGAAASGAYQAVEAGENRFGSLVLPSNQMSDGDRGKLRQIAHFRIINAYVSRYLSVNPEARAQLYPVYGPPLPADLIEPSVPDVGETETGSAGREGATSAAEQLTGGPTASAVDDAVMEAVKNSIETELKTAMETATAVTNSTIEFMWGEDDTRGHGIGDGGSGSAESAGVTGFLRFRDLEGSVLRETLSLSPDAKAAIGSLPNEGDEMLVHRFIGGSVGGVVDYSYLQNLTVNVEGGAAQVGVAANGSPKLIVRTHWHWDRWGADVDTYMRNEIYVTDSGTIHVTEQRERSPNDEPWASEPVEPATPISVETAEPPRSP